MTNVDTVAGWDAAWTPGGSGAWCWAVVEPSGRLRVETWEETPAEEEALRGRLGELLTRYRPDWMAVDLPVGRQPVTGYREADRATTRAFSRFGCPVHSPTPDRPGAWGECLMNVLRSHGFRVATGEGDTMPAVAEVYPHTALLDLLRVRHRFPYKVTKARRYWPELTPGEARARVLENLERMHARLSGEMTLPAWRELRPVDPSSAALKRLEDLLDAAVCAASAVRVARGEFRPFGNGTAAIWNPDPADWTVPA